MGDINPTYVSNQRTGDVWLENFDVGVVETMDGFVSDGDYFIQIPGVPNTPWPTDRESRSVTFAERGETMPGVMVTFASPDDRITPFVYPCIVIRRESIEPAPSRWPSRHLKYRTPADGANPVSYQYYDRNGSLHIVNGYDQYEEQLGNHPFDITYMISVLASSARAETHAQLMLKRVLRTYPPRDGLGVRVKDSLGDTRAYEVFSEGPAGLREALDMVDHQAGYSVNIRVEGELDLKDPYVAKVATSLDFQYGLGVN